MTFTIIRLLRGEERFANGKYNGPVDHCEQRKPRAWASGRVRISTRSRSREREYLILRALAMPARMQAPAQCWPGDVSLPLKWNGPCSEELKHHLPRARRPDAKTCISPDFGPHPSRRQSLTADVAAARKFGANCS